VHEVLEDGLCHGVAAEQGGSDIGVIGDCAFVAALLREGFERERDLSV
jgi:hypothetical protein